MAERKIEICTFHGWALSADIWLPWENHLPSDIYWKHADKGYFGNRADVSFSRGVDKKILLVHSYGLHWCPPALLKETDHLVILSSFLSFHPEEPEKFKRSKLLLQKMMSRFVEKPYEVLYDFHQNVYSPDACKPEFPDSLDHDLLLNDLDLLGESQISPNLLHQIPGITIIHGSSDKIVSKRKGRELYTVFNRRSQYLEIKGSGHAAGFIHARKSSMFMSPALEISEAQNRL